MEYPTLYMSTKGNKTVIWNITVRCTGGAVYVIREWGQEGGKVQSVSTEVTTGKNIGRKNETTKLEQAHVVARSFYNKRLDEGASTDRNTGVVVLPMLAHKWDDHMKKMPLKCVIQPKLDGVRAVVGNDNGVIVIKTRLGKPILSMNHIKSAIEKLHLANGQYLDGELYSDEVKFEEISGACRKHESTPVSRLLKFYVFDQFFIHSLSMQFNDRYAALCKLTLPPAIVLVASKHAKTSEIETALRTFIDDGYEGVMIRDPSSQYTLNQRSYGLLKYKRFIDREYKIVDAVEGTGRDKGTVIWTCEISPNGPRFNVRPQGTIEHRTKGWKNRHTHIGKMLTVKYQELTKTGIPRFPSAIDIRDYE